MVLVKYRTDKLALTKSFSSSIFDTLSPAKLDACNVAYACIITNFIVGLELLDNTTLLVDSGSEGNQSEDNYSLSAKNMLDVLITDGITEWGTLCY